MVCQIFYASEYIQDCDISKFGEGCEKCVPLFQSSLMLPVFVVGICLLAIVIISITYMILYRNKSFPTEEMQF